jgi:2-methylcitrate dehydratase PrpD
LIDQLGERYEIVGTNLKRWTVGSPIQAPLDAMEALLKRGPIDPGQVEEVLVRSAPGSVVDNSDPPDINIQFAMALMLIDRTATFRSIHDKARMDDPAILRLRNKVKLEAPPRVQGGQPLPLLEVSLTSGQRLTQDTGAVLGTIDNPMTERQLTGKCRDLMTPVLSGATSQRLIDRILALDKVKDIRELRPLLQRSYREGAPRLSEYPTATR